MAFYTKGIAASNMVLLRNETNCIIGSAPAGKQIEMEFRGKKYSSVSDKDGNWKIEFNPGDACKGEKIVLSCKGEKKITFSDVAVGEVWLCSGQSNMQLTFDRLRFAYPEEFKKKENSDIRMITIPVVADFSGERDYVENPEWLKPSPKTLAGMSGTAYFFAKKIQEDLGVPVGVINASQGGTPITAWMNAKSFEGIGNYSKRYEEVCKKDFVPKTLEENKTKSDKWNKLINEADLGLKEKWEKIPYSKISKSDGNGEDAADGWGTFKIPGTCKLIKNAGIVWFKKEFELTEKQLETLKKEGARIWLGTIRDADTVFINGVQVGITYYMYPPRRYAFDPAVLKAGKNTVTIRVQQNCKWGQIHFFLEKPYAITSEKLKIPASIYRNVERKEMKDFRGVYIPLDGEWKCRTGCQVENAPSTVFIEYEPAGLYNAMLSPCFNTAIRGAVWYQGESNALGFAEYEELLCNMIKLWRSKFTYAAKQISGSGFPFVVMQLPNWANDTLPCAGPVFSDWALLRETQYGAVTKTKNTAISVMIDAGEWNDLHPEKKLTGGTRTAEQALRLAYGKNYVKPAVIKSAELSKDKKYFTVKFNSEIDLTAYEAEGENIDWEKTSKNVEGFGILVRGKIDKDVPLEMQGEVDLCKAELCGKKAVKVFIPENVNLSDIVEVRYLWANCPPCVNLYAGTNPVMPGRVKLS